jgi:hypothetical protein
MDGFPIRSGGVASGLGDSSFLMIFTGIPGTMTMGFLSATTLMMLELTEYLEWIPLTGLEAGPLPASERPGQTLSSTPVSRERPKGFLTVTGHLAPGLAQTRFALNLLQQELSDSNQ